MHGKGVNTWADGRKYEGEYYNDKKDGFGVWTWADGRKYVGYWKDGKRHGIGKLFSNGAWRWGNWNEGQRISWINDMDDSVFKYRDGTTPKELPK